MAEPPHAAGAHRHAAGTGQAAVGNHRYLDAPGSDGGQRMGQVKLKRPAAHRGVVHIAGVHIEIVGQVHPAVADAAGRRKKAVHIGFGQAGVGQRLDDAFALNLQFALVRSVAGDVLVDAYDGGGAPQVNHAGYTSIVK